MKIAFVGPLPPPLGGVAVINKGLQELTYDGCEVLSFNTSSDNLRENLYGNLNLGSLVRNLKLLFKLYSFLRNERPDIVNVFITSGRSVLRDILFLMPAKVFGVPSIIHFHSKIAGEFALKPSRLRMLSVVFKWFSRKVLVLSDHHFAFFSSYFGVRHCGVLENFVRYEDYSCSIHEKSDRFLYVGRLTKEKGFFELLDALKFIEQRGVKVCVDVVGVAQSEEEESFIKQLITDYCIGHIVCLHGALFGAEKFNLFKRAKCLIFPSHFENSPVVLKEAIAARMGIIASDLSANKNVLTDLGNHLLFPKGSPEALANRIIDIAEDTRLALRLCEASSKIIKYDESVAMQKMLEFFTEVTDEPD